MTLFFKLFPVYYYHFPRLLLFLSPYIIVLFPSIIVLFSCRLLKRMDRLMRRDWLILLCIPIENRNLFSAKSLKLAYLCLLWGVWYAIEALRPGMCKQIERSLNKKLHFPLVVCAILSFVIQWEVFFNAVGVIESGFESPFLQTSRFS